MNSDQVRQLIQGIGVMAELWTITFKGFKAQGMGDGEALMHTKAFMSIMMDTVIDSNGTTKEEDI